MEISGEVQWGVKRGDIMTNMRQWHVAYKRLGVAGYILCVRVEPKDKISQEYLRSL